ncbi:MAG: thiamine-phosphate kinase [Bacteroidales bacterium]|nr:thiamine-phosphate kinase [Bacteroidales bacterium]
MSNKNKKQEIETIGEFGLIRLLTSKIKLQHPSSVLGVGDDAAVLDMGDSQIVVTTDLLTEGIHFDLIYTPLKHLGYKAVVVNLSDVYAMNARPSQILVSIAVSAKFSTDMIEELYEGMHLACELYGVDMVGGDTSSSLTGITICVTAIGSAHKDKITRRSGAKENDLVCVSGDLGGAFMGLQLLEREKRVYSESGNIQPDLSGYDYVLERQLKPEARHDVIKWLDEKGIQPTSMIDISDGLSSEILHICDASGVGCKLYAEKIPVAEDTRKTAEEMGLEAVTIALNGGEDYELLFTAPLDAYEALTAIEGITILGHITSKSEGSCLVLQDGSLAGISALGWNSMKSGD